MTNVIPYRLPLLARVPELKVKHARARTAFPVGWEFGEPEKDAARKVGMPTLAVLKWEWEKFADHHLSHGKAMADWPAAWRYWCKNWAERNPRYSRNVGAQGPAATGFSAIAGMFDNE